MSLQRDDSFLCPYCGEPNELGVDLSAGSRQKFVVDCTVCCAPIVVRLAVRGETIISLDAQKENG